MPGSFTLVSRRNACQLKSAKASPDTIFELDFTFGQIDYSSLPHKEEVLAYWNICDSSIDLAVDALDITNPDCGFFWYKVSKIEHQLISLRHLQHHMAQLGDRIRAATNTGIGWIGSRH